MSERRLCITRGAAISIGLYLACAGLGFAQVIPGPADVNRIRPEQKEILPDRSQDQRVAIPTVVPSAPVPEAAKQIHFVLRDVHIEGVTAFARDAFRDLYAPYIGQDITLDKVWTITGAITERYRNAGYFLSRAFVPEQRIADGIITIKVVEGYIGKVELGNTLADHQVVRRYIERLQTQKPVTTDEMESFLLRLNDLPGLSFRAVLSALENAEEGAVKLTLQPTAKQGAGSVTFDNYGSRYLGPHEVSAIYQTSLLPLQQTTLSGLTSLPADELRYGVLTHSIAIAPDLTLEATGGITKAYPDFTLKPLEIDSQSDSLGISLLYQYLRQREKNLSFKLTLDGRNTTSDSLHTLLTRDHVRALRVNASFDASDRFSGYNVASVTLSHGLKLFDSSDKGDLNLSRAKAVPDFTKAEFSLSRLQAVAQSWSVLAMASGQIVPDLLYSSEEYGYGGQAFGRAYDASEITGEHGLSGSLELRYDGWNDWRPVSLQPYAFYDIGRIWNKDLGQPAATSGSSAGFGLRFVTSWHMSANLGVAFPLTRDITTPIYGGNGQNPRLLLQISQSF